MKDRPTVKKVVHEKDMVLTLEIRYMFWINISQNEWFDDEKYYYHNVLVFNNNSFRRARKNENYKLLKD